MRLSLSRRIVAYFVDAMPILLLVVSMQSLFVGDLIKSQFENYDEQAATYNENFDLYDQRIRDLQSDVDDGIITEDQYITQATALNDEFYELYGDEYETVMTYVITSFSIGFFAFVLLYYVYMLVLKGNSLGRHLMGGELTGHVTWYSILAREVVWKHFFWLIFFIVINFVQLYIGIPFFIAAIFMISGITFDMALIGFTQKKMTLRDKLSQTQVTYKGVKYPF